MGTPFSVPLLWDGERSQLAAPPRESREFKDVVFEDVVFDNNSLLTLLCIVFDCNIYVKHIIIKHHILELPREVLHY